MISALDPEAVEPESLVPPLHDAAIRQNKPTIAKARRYSLA
jgi:hypothetical protein